MLKLKLLLTAAPDADAAADTDGCLNLACSICHSADTSYLHKFLIEQSRVQRVSSFLQRAANHARQHGFGAPIKQQQQHFKIIIRNWRGIWATKKKQSSQLVVVRQPPHLC